MPTASELGAAATVVADHLRPTPLVAAPELGVDVFLKLEGLQPTGSYKARGALNAIASVPEDAQIVTGSGGNHGLAVAWAAIKLGRRPAHVVVPRKASPVKVEALRRLGVRPEPYGESVDEAEEHAIRLAEKGAVYVSPYNDRAVIAGQSTIGRELDEQIDGPIQVVVPVGAGGLVSGIGLWAAGRAEATVVGVEAAASRPVSAAVSAGKVVRVAVSPTIADALAGNIDARAITPEIAAGTVERFVAVSEPELSSAVRFLSLRCGVTAEGAGAAGVAALLAGHLAVPSAGERLVLIVTGRNIAAEVLRSLL